MKKILFILLMVILFFSCKKENINIKGTMDLKHLSLPHLKTFLNGEWRLHRLDIFTIAGYFPEKVPDSVKVYLTFYPTDSVKRTSSLSNRVIREKLVYKYLSLPGMGEKSAYVLMFDADVFGYRNKWVADSLVKDTLIFTNYFRSEGLNRYYYTKTK